MYYKSDATFVCTLLLCKKSIWAVALLIIFLAFFLFSFLHTQFLSSLFLVYFSLSLSLSLSLTRLLANSLSLTQSLLEPFSFFPVLFQTRNASYPLYCTWHIISDKNDFFPHPLLAQTPNKNQIVHLVCPFKCQIQLQVHLMDSSTMDLPQLPQPIHFDRWINVFA